MPISAKIIHSISVTSLIAKSYIHMFVILATFNARRDNFGSDKLRSLKEIMVSLYWMNLENAIYTKFEFLIKNNI